MTTATTNNHRADCTIEKCWSCGKRAHHCEGSVLRVAEYDEMGRYSCDEYIWKCTCCLRMEAVLRKRKLDRDRTHTQDDNHNQIPPIHSQTP